MDLLRVDMFLVDFNFARYPGPTNLGTQRRQHLEQKPLHPKTHQGVRKVVADLGDLAGFEHIDDAVVQTNFCGQARPPVKLFDLRLQLG